MTRQELHFNDGTKGIAWGYRSFADGKLPQSLALDLSVALKIIDVPKRKAVLLITEFGKNALT